MAGDVGVIAPFEESKILDLGGLSDFGKFQAL
jgi:hypothetical protein